MFEKGLLILFLVTANGFFVAAEFALVKVRIGEIRALALAGSRTAAIVERIVHRLDAYLSACQLGITLASLGLGWVGEPLVARTLEPLFAAWGAPDSPVVHLLSATLAFALITFLHITAGEQAPKILAIQKHQPTALAVSWPLFIFYKIFQPFIWLLNTSSNLMLRAVGIRLDAAHGETLTEDALRNILLDSAGWVHVTPRERLIMGNVLDLEKKPARRYMVPRNQIIYLNREDTMEEKLQKAAASGRTRLPLCEGDLGHIIGIVHVKDVFQAIVGPNALTALVGVSRKALFLPERITLDVLLREFQKEHSQLAMLVDEYGVVSGMITLEDVLEELVGPIQDEFDREVPHILQKGPHQFEVNAMCPIDDVVKRCQIVFSEETLSDTIGGVITDLLGHIPKVGEQVVIGPHEITILSAEPTRVHRILIQQLTSESPLRPHGNA
ncbi:MAG: hemolysin family protein [bacterium]|nr:hemolysin family protein [bacterium]